jgi:amino-acid N-acetyltransferase
MTDPELQRLVGWFRQSSPYIHAHRGATFVIAVGGEIFNEGTLPALVHDLALLNTLGIRLVLVPGARPQIDECLQARGLAPCYQEGVRITDEAAMACVKSAVGSVRMEFEALLSMGLANSPMAGLRVRVASGNLVTARPIGVRNGIDYLHTGEVRRIDSQALRQRLDDGAVVIASPVGYSPTGEAFNCSREDVALSIASALGAEKLLFLRDEDGLPDADGGLVREMTTEQARGYLAREADEAGNRARAVRIAIDACHRGVNRVHFLGRQRDGVLLMELFTRDGVGTLVTSHSFERLRAASVDDVGGILELIEPLEREGVLVRRSRELLETEIERFLVMEREGTVVACAALYPLGDSRSGELACVVVHPDYRGSGRGERILERMEASARSQGLDRLFVLTTRAPHWFQERGFEPANLTELPVGRRELYNYRRNSRVFTKGLTQQDA